MRDGFYMFGQNMFAICKIASAFEGCQNAEYAAHTHLSCKQKLKKYLLKMDKGTID